jgi:hypothetical protein
VYKPPVEALNKSFSAQTYLSSDFRFAGLIVLTYFWDFNFGFCHFLISALYWLCPSAPSPIILPQYQFKRANVLVFFQPSDIQSSLFL